MTPAGAAKARNRRGSMRRRPRTSIKVECRKGDTGLNANVAVQALDISETGVRLIISEQLPLMCEVEIVVLGYGMRKSIKRGGNIRWIVNLEDGNFCVGVEFQKRLVYRDWLILAAPG